MNETLELTEATTNWLNKANQIFGQTFPMPTISLHLRGGTAGKANASKWLIKYNPELYVRNKQDFVDRTVPHELAHLISRRLYGNIKSHGREWKTVMMKLGIEEITRCHNYDISGIKKTRNRPYVYTCGCKEFHLTQLLHNKILRGQRRWCLKCKGTIVFKRVEI